MKHINGAAECCQDMKPVQLVWREAHLSGLDITPLTCRQDSLALVHLFQQLLISPEPQGNEREVGRKRTRTDGGEEGDGESTGEGVR